MASVVQVPCTPHDPPLPGSILTRKAARAAGPFPHERELFGIGGHDTAREGDVARHLLRPGIGPRSRSTGR